MADEKDNINITMEDVKESDTNNKIIDSERMLQDNQEQTDKTIGNEEQSEAKIEIPETNEKGSVKKDINIDEEEGNTVNKKDNKYSNNEMFVQNREELERQQNISRLNGDYYESAKQVTNNTINQIINPIGEQIEGIVNSLIIDPSREYFFDSYDRVIYDVKVSKIAEALKKERIIFITCLNNQITNDVGCSLFRELKCKDKSLECRVLFPGNEKEREICQSFPSLFNDDRCKIGKGNNTFLIIDEVDTILFDSFTTSSLSRLSTMIGNATRNNNYVVILIHKPSQIKAINNIDDIRFKKFKIDFLDVLLNYHQLSPVLGEILEQKDKGLWGNSQEEFYRWVTGFLQFGSSRLIKEIEIRSKYKEGDDLNDFVSKNITKIKVDDLISKSPIAIYLAYISTYLPELSLNKLEELLEILFEGEPTISKTIEKLNSEGEKILIEEKIALMSLWNDPNDGADRILFDSQIRLFEDEDGLEYYGFSEPYLTESFKTFFKQQKRRFLQNAFKKILKSGIFFDPKTTGKLLESLTALSLNMIVKNPEDFGLHRMLGIFHGTHYLQNEIQEENDVYVKVFKSLKKHHILNRLCLLLIEMLKTPKLNHLVDDILISQINIGQHNIVFDVIKKLHHSPDFDSLFWLKRLLDNGTKDVKREAYKQLLAIAFEKPDRIQDILEDLSSWHPVENNVNFSPSNHASQSFLVDFVFEVNYADPGSYPVTYCLFVGSTKQNLAELTIKSIDWLFNKNILASVNAVRLLFGHKEVKLETIQSDIIEYWYLMLCGKTLTPRTECLEIFISVLMVIGELIDREQKESIYIAFQMRMERILNWLEDLDGYSPIGLKELNEKQDAFDSGQSLYQINEFISNLFRTKIIQKQ